MQDTCFKVVDDNAATVLKSDAFKTLPFDLMTEILNRDTLPVSESIVCDAVLQWIDENDTCMGAVLQKCVRLTEMPAHKLLELSDKNVFCDSDVLGALKVQVKPLWEKMKPRGRKGYYCRVHVYVDVFGRFVFSWGTLMNA